MCECFLKALRIRSSVALLLRFVRRMLTARLLFLLVVCCSWVFHPLLFIRRLYRLCVGLLVLYVLHFLLGYLGAKVAAAREWWRVERGLWRGEEQWVRKRELTLAMASAPDYTTWRAAASQLDLLESERMAWKAYRPSTEYHWYEPRMHSARTQRRCSSVLSEAHDILLLLFLSLSRAHTGNVSRAMSRAFAS